MRKKVLILIICIVLHIVSARDLDIDSEDDYDNYNEKIYKKFVKMDKQLKELAEQSVRKLLPYLLEAREYVNITAKCTKNLFDLMIGFRKLTIWSFNCKYFALLLLKRFL